MLARVNQGLESVERTELDFDVSADFFGAFPQDAKILD